MELFWTSFIFFVTWDCVLRVWADVCETEMGAACANGAICTSNEGKYYVSAFCECKGDFHGLTCDKPGKLDRVAPQLEPVFFDAKYPAQVGTKSFVGIFIKKPGEKFRGKLKLPNHELTFDEQAFLNTKFSEYGRKYKTQLNYYNSWVSDEVKQREQKGSELFLLYPVSTRVSKEFECLVELGNIVDNKMEVQYKAKFKITIEENRRGCVPEVALQDCAQDPKQLINWNRGVENVARSSAQRGCPSYQTKFSRQWAVFKMCSLIEGEPSSMPFPIEVQIPDYYFGKCVESVYTIEATKELKVPPFTLSYGTIAITLVVIEETTENQDRKTASNSAICWVSVKPGPLKAKIGGNDFKTVGEEAQVVLDGSPSYDPNEPKNNQNIRYKWSCFVAADPNDPDCKKDVALGTDVTFAPSFKLKIGNQYSFQLNIESSSTGDNIPAGDKTIQEISVIAGSPPELHIECILNCAYVSRASHTEVVFLQVVCTGSCADDMSPDKYEWSSDASPDLDWDADTLFGKHSDKLAIKEKVLKEGQEYTFTVTLIGPMGTSTDKYMVKMNKRPIIATNPPCTWTPDSGTVATEFTITCSGFNDEDEDWPLRFYIYQSDNLDHGEEENYGVVMAYLLVEYPWRFEKGQLRLMEGDAGKGFKSTITIKVKDHFGMDVVFSFELQINEQTPWTAELVTAMYSGEDPSSLGIPSVQAMLEGGDSSRAVRLIASLSQGLSRIEGDDDDEKLHQFRVDMKEKLVADLGKIPVRTASALDQVTGAMQQVLQADKEPVHHKTARMAANQLQFLSEYLLSRAYKDVLPGHVPTKEVKKIAQYVTAQGTILSSLSSVLVGVSEEPQPPKPPAVSQQEVEYPSYDDYQGDAVETVVDSNVAADHMVESIDLIGRSIAYRLAESLGETVIRSENIALSVIVDTPTKLSERFVGDKEAGITISRDLGKSIEATSPVINLQVAVTNKNPLWFKKHLTPTNADYVFLSVYDRKPKKADLERQSWRRSMRSIGYQPAKPLDIFLPLKSSGTVYTENTTTIHLTKDYLDLEFEIIVFRVVVEEGSLLRVDFKNDESYPRLSVVLTRDERPSIADFDKAHSIPSKISDDADKYAVLFPEKSDDSKSEWFYLGILPDLDDLKENIKQGKKEMSFKYAFMLSSIKCCYWSLQKNMWMTEGCVMMPDTTKSRLHCQCKHLSLFSGSFLATPSKIDPYHAMDLLLFTMFGNPLIIGFITIILTELILLLAWALYKRRDDSRARCITILEDCRYYDRCGYLIVVYTGRPWQAGTSANIGIQLQGTRSKSSSHVLKDSTRRTLLRNTDSWFLMFTRENLGEIKSIRLWTDCSGHYPAWFCDKISVTSLETKCTQVFVVNNWLSLTNGDSLVYRVIESATRQEIFDRKLLFKDYVRLGFRDSHLWFGIWSMHPRSTLTRVERVGVLGCFIMTLMLVNLILYGIPNSANPASQIDDLTYDITVREVAITIAGILIAILVTVIISLFFTKTNALDERNRPMPPSTQECQDDQFLKVEASEKMDENRCLFNVNDFELNDGSCFARSVWSLMMVEPLVPATTCTPVRGAKSPVCVCQGKCECPPRKKSPGNEDCAYHLRVNQSSPGSSYNWFPHWFLYVAWSICTCTIVVSAIFIIYFGSLFGEIKTWLWLTTVGFAVVLSLLVIEPLKIVIIAALQAMLFQKCPKTMRPDCDIDVKHGGKRESYFQIKNSDDRVKHRQLRKMYSPLPLREREKLKSEIELHKKMSDKCIDLVLFVIFILCLYVVVWYSRDSLSFESTKNIHNMVVAGTYGTKSDFNEVNSMVTFQEFLTETVIHGLQATDNYNNLPTNDVGVTSDFSTHLLGIPRLRQLRVRDNSCSVNELFNKTITECLPEYTWYNADTSNYSVGWTRKWKAYEDLGAKLKDPWLFRDAMESGSLPMRGQFSTYPGSGYIADLGRTRQNSLIILQFLFDYEWFDPNTRVVFVEFTTYSSSQNLFNVVALVAERSATGDWGTTANIKTVKLLVTTSEATLGGKIAFVVCTVVLSLHLFRNVSKLYTVGWKKFFTHMWNVVDFFIVCLCIACIVLYIKRSSYVSALLKHLEDTQHNEYVSFQAAAFWDIILNYAMALLVCIATVRIWKLLRFGEKFRMLEKTLYSAAEALISLSIMLMIIMCMFVLFSYLLMGNNVSHFRDPYTALTTLFASTIGFHDLDMNDLWAAHPVLGPLFFLCFLMVSSIYLVNMFITVVVCYYEEAKRNVEEEKNSYGPIDYLLYEIRFHFGIFKQKGERLRGGADESTHPIAIPKPEKVRLENSESVTKNRMEAMRLLTVGSLRTRLKGGDVEGGDNQTVSDERMEAMLRITVDELTKDDTEDKEKEIFYKGRIEDDVKFVPETRIVEAENLVNKFGKSRMTVNREKLEAFGDTCEQLNNSLDYIAHLLDQVDSEPEGVEKPSMLEDNIERKHKGPPHVAKRKEFRTPTPGQSFFEPSSVMPKQDTDEASSRQLPFTRPQNFRPKSYRESCLSRPQRVTNEIPSSTPKNEPITAIKASKSELNTPIGVSKSELNTSKTVSSGKCQRLTRKDIRPSRCRQIEGQEKRSCRERSRDPQNLTDDGFNAASISKPGTSCVARKIKHDAINPVYIKTGSESEVYDANALSTSKPNSDRAASNCKHVTFKEKLSPRRKSDLIEAPESHKETIKCEEEYNGAPNSKPPGFNSKTKTPNAVTKSNTVFLKSEPSSSTAGLSSDLLSGLYQRPPRCKHSEHHKNCQALAGVDDRVSDSSTQELKASSKPHHDFNCRNRNSPENLENSIPAANVEDESDENLRKASKTANENISDTRIKEVALSSSPGKRPLGCRPKEFTRNKEYDSYSHSSSEETNKKEKPKKHHEGRPERCSREQDPKTDKEFSPRQDAGKCPGKSGKHKKRHHRAECPRSHDMNIPQCRRRLQELEAIEAQRSRNCKGTEDASDREEKDRKND